AVEAAREEGDGCAATCQRGAMGGTVDAVGGAGYDRVAAIDEPRRELDRHMLAVAGCRACTHDRHTAIEVGQCVATSAKPEGDGGVLGEIAERSRPVGIPRYHEVHGEAR